MEFKSEELNEAAGRVITHSSLEFLKIQDQLKKILEWQRMLRAYQILAKHEIYEASAKTEHVKLFLNDDQCKEEEIHLREERNQLHKALIKHKSLKEFFQNASFESQIQNAVIESLEAGIVLPDVRSGIEHYKNNLDLSSELSKVIGRTEELEREILFARLRYRTLLQSIENKWKVLTGRGSPRTPRHDDNEEIKRLEEKTNKRQDRLHIVVCLLRNLISCSGELWGSNEKFIELLLLCDDTCRFFDSNDDLSDDMKELNLSDDKYQDPRKTSIEKFVSSTPKK